MSNRRVQVDLVLNARNYLDESKKVLAEVKAQEKALEGLGDEADLTGADLEGLTQTTSHTTETLGGLGSKSRDTGEALRILDERIAKTKISVRELGIEFAHTGDAATGKQLDSERSMLGRLTRLRKEVAAAHEELQKLADVGGGDGKRGNLLTRLLGTVQDAFAAGVKIGGSVVSGFGSAFSAMGPHIKAIAIGALVAAAVAASPTIAAMIGGAVTLGVGTIGLAGGIMAAINNPTVQAAAQNFGASIGTMFFSSGDSFVGPITNALEILKRGFRDLDLKATFALAAPYVTVLAKGIADMGRTFMPLFRDALKSAGPALQTMADQLPRLGTALGGMLKRMAESKGTVQGVMALFGLLEGTLIGIGEVIGWLSDRYYEFNQAQALVTGHLANLLGRGNPVGEMFGKMHDQVQKFIEQSKNLPPVVDEAAVALEAVRAQMRVTGDATAELIGKTKDLYDRTMAIARANLGVKQSFADLAQSYRDNGKTLDDHTQKGRDNWLMTLDTVDAVMREHDANIANGQTMAVANIIYQANIEKLIEQAKKAGASAEQVQILTDKLNQVPKLTLAEIRLQFEQGGTSLGEHSGLRKGELDPPKTPPKPPPKNPPGRGQPGKRRAHGGGVGPGEWVVGDGGRPEVLTIGAGTYGHVYPSVPAWQAAQAPAGGWQSGSSGGGGTTQIELTIRPAPGADQRVMSAITEGLRYDVDTKSAGNVQVHLSRRRR